MSCDKVKTSLSIKMEFIVKNYRKSRLLNDFTLSFDGLF